MYTNTNTIVMYKYITYTFVDQRFSVMLGVTGPSCIKNSNGLRSSDTVLFNSSGKVELRVVVHAAVQHLGFDVSLPVVVCGGMKQLNEN